MATSVVRTFDLYDTTIYWNGYSAPGYDKEQQVTRAFYTSRFSANPIGSQIDFFRELTGIPQGNPAFTLNDNANSYTIDGLPILWGKYWWDEAMYYSHPVVYDIITTNNAYYRAFSECVGSLYYCTKYNTNLNAYTKIYSELIEPLFIPSLASNIDTFYSTANSLFVTNIANIGPGNGTDVTPGSGVNGNLIMANTDYNRRVSCVSAIPLLINDLYPQLSRFLSFNNNIIGNLIFPYSKSLSATCEDNVIQVDYTNTSIISSKQLTMGTLITENERV